MKQVPPGRIHGEVIIGATGKPLANSPVRVLVDDVVVDLKRTNRSGLFKSRLLFAGTYTIVVDHNGHYGTEYDVEVKLNEVTTVTLHVS